MFIIELKGLAKQLNKMFKHATFVYKWRFEKIEFTNENYKGRC